MIYCQGNRLLLKPHTDHFNTWKHGWWRHYFAINTDTLGLCYAGVIFFHISMNRQMTWWSTQFIQVPGKLKCWDIITHAVICTNIKALAANDEIMHSVAKIGFVAVCLGIWPSHWEESCYVHNMQICNSWLVKITRLLGRPQPQMYPPVALNQYTLVNRTHKHYIYMLQGPTNILKSHQSSTICKIWK